MTVLGKIVTYIVKECFENMADLKYRMIKKECNAFKNLLLSN